jgi:hypothetical protein
VKDKRARPVRFEGVRHHDDHRIVLIDEGQAVQTLVLRLLDVHRALRKEARGVGKVRRVAVRRDVDHRGQRL